MKNCRKPSASSQSVLNNPADNEEENGKGKSHDGRTLGESLEEAFLSGSKMYILHMILLMIIMRTCRDLVYPLRVPPGN